MKKAFSFAMIGAVALGFASCSSDEVLDQAPNQKLPIGFSTFVDNSTRGVDLNTDNIDAFTVWGGYKSVISGGNYTDLYDNVNVTKVGTDWTYASDKLQYWTLGDAYWFAAIAGSNYTYTPDFTSYWSNKGNGTLKFDQTAAAGQVDLCYAWKSYDAVTDAEATAKVGFTFNHMLSRVTFTFNNNMPNASDKLKISEVSFNSTLDGNDATLNFYNADPWDGKPFWTGGTPKSGNNLSTAVSNEIFNINNGVTTEPLYIIPYNAAANAFYVSFKIDYYQNGVLEKTFYHNVNLPAVNYEIGKAYNLIANIDGSNIDPTGVLKPIEFSVETVSDWGAVNNNNIW